MHSTAVHCRNLAVKDVRNCAIQMLFLVWEFPQVINCGVNLTRCCNQRKKEKKRKKEVSVNKKYGQEHRKQTLLSNILAGEVSIAEIGPDFKQNGYCTCVSTSMFLFLRE